jgi:ribosome-associated protein
MQHTFTLTAEYIELNKLLKIFNLVESGSAAKKAITDGLVSVNGTVEHRIRNKLLAGAVVSYNGSIITVEK